VRLFILSVTLLLSIPCLSQNKKKEVNISDFIQETRLSKTGSSDIVLVLWMPYEYWEASFKLNPNISPDQYTKTLELLSDYDFYAVIKGSYNAFGAITYIEADSIKNNFTRISKDGKVTSPIAEKDLDNEVAFLINILKPIMGNMIGQMGENMVFLPFKAKENDVRIANPFSNDFINVKLFNDEFTYRFPIGALLEEKFCPVDKEKLSGAWQFCPRHGIKL
jgi:hypothetical protein